MKRSSWEGDTIVYKYRCPRTAKLPDHALDQLQRGLNLRRDLVGADYRYDEMRNAIWLEHPAVGAAQELVDQAVAEFSEVKEQLLDERVIDRSTKARTSTHAAIVAARKKVTAARAELKQARTVAGPDVIARLDELETARRAAWKQLRKEAVEDGLFWATGNAILDDHVQAAKQVRKLRKDGRAAQRRMPRWNDAATLSTQVQRGEGNPARTGELLASGKGPYRNVVQLAPWFAPEDWPKGRGPHRRGELTLRIAGSGQPPLVLPVFIDRPIPPDADVTDVQVTRRFIADKQRLSVAVTLRVPTPPKKTEGEVVAVRIGWQGVGEGSVKVATVATPTGPLPGHAPENVKDLVLEHDSCTNIYASSGWRKILERTARIRGYRDELLDKIKVEVSASLDADKELAAEMAEALNRESLDVSRWRSPARMVRLTRAWPEDHPLKETLEAWRKRDAHLWQYEAHERDQIIARRRDSYRKLAAWICEHARKIVLSGVNIAEVTKVPAVGTEDPHADRNARANRQWAAPGDFRALLLNAAARRGIEVVMVTTEPGSEDAAPATSEEK